ncbi:MAG: hypothetical protein IPM69_03510 [Ignavibacteria bacterium]|nr:hypothetical protein [Ignavibacteria bacterium]
MYDYRRNGEPLYEASQSEPGGVVIKVRKSVYYFDLKRITHYSYTSDNQLSFKIIGNMKADHVSGELALCLFGALSDWHKKRKPK